MNERIYIIKCPICGGTNEAIELVGDKQIKAKCFRCKDGTIQLRQSDGIRDALVALKEELIKCQEFARAVVIREAVEQYDKVTAIQDKAEVKSV